MAVLHPHVTAFNLELLLLTDQPLPIAQNSSKYSPWDLYLLEAYGVESWDNLWLGKSGSMVIWCLLPGMCWWHVWRQPSPWQLCSIPVR